MTAHGDCPPTCVYCTATRERHGRHLQHAALENLARCLAAAGLLAMADRDNWMNPHGTHLRHRAARIAFEGLEPVFDGWFRVPR